MSPGTYLWQVFLLPPVWWCLRGTSHWRLQGQCYHSEEQKFKIVLGSDNTIKIKENHIDTLSTPVHLSIYQLLSTTTATYYTVEPKAHKFLRFPGCKLTKLWDWHISGSIKAMRLGAKAKQAIINFILPLWYFKRSYDYTFHRLLNTGPDWFLKDSFLISLSWKTSCPKNYMLDGWFIQASLYKTQS